MLSSFPLVHIVFHLHGLRNVICCLQCHKLPCVCHRLSQSSLPPQARPCLPLYHSKWKTNFVFLIYMVLLHWHGLRKVVHCLHDHKVMSHSPNSYPQDIASPSPGGKLTLSFVICIVLLYGLRNVVHCLHSYKLLHVIVSLSPNPLNQDTAHSTYPLPPSGKLTLSFVICIVFLYLHGLRNVVHCLHSHKFLRIIVSFRNFSQPRSGH